MALASTSQNDFGGGIFRQRTAPPAGMYDAVNALINDDTFLFKRGGSAYRSNADAGDALTGLFDGYLSASLRTLAWTAAGATNLAYILGSDDATPIALIDMTVAIDPFARGATANGILSIPSAAAGGVPFLWGGARIAAANTTAPTVGLTKDSAVMTCSATSWTTKYEAGSIVGVTGASQQFGFTVASVDSDTQITLSGPWTDPTGTYTASIENYYSNPAQGLRPVTRFVATTGSPARSWSITGNNRAYYTPRGDPVSQFGTNYIDLPTSSYIIGADSFQDSLLLFTTDGVWAVTNTELDPVDSFGNIQWGQQQITRELILWGDPGISAYEGRLVVPAIDDIYMFSPGSAPDSITQWTIRSLYRSYVKAGYSPGRAATFRGHYFLPIMNGMTVVDVLVARLDRPHMLSARPRIWIYPWTRWSGHAACGAYVARAAHSVTGPVLLATQAQRILDLSSTFDADGSNSVEADGSVHTFAATTNDYPMGTQPAFMDRLRLTYELTPGGGDIPDSFDRPDTTITGGGLGPDWTADPFDHHEEGLSIDSHAVAPDPSGQTSRSWLTGYIVSENPAVRCVVKARPASNVDTVVYAAVGLLQNPGTPSASGYELRLRFETAADNFAIYRYDNCSPTRILDPTSVGGIRFMTGDTMALTLSSSGTLSALKNGAVIGTVSDTTYFHASEPAHVFLGIVDSSTGSPQSAIRLDSSGPTVAVEFSSDQDGGGFTTLTEFGLQGGGTGAGASDASTYSWWKVGKRREKIRFRITQSGGAGTFVLRMIEMLSRQQGRQ